MKRFSYFFLFLISVNAFAFSSTSTIFSREFTIRLEPTNSHTNLKDIRVVVFGNAEGGDSRGPTGARLYGKDVIAEERGDNVYFVPGFRYKSKASGLFSTAFVDAKVGYQDISNESRNPYDRKLEHLITEIGNNSHDNRSWDATDWMNKFFESTLFVTTIPKLDFKLSGTMILPSGETTLVQPKNIECELEYYLLDEGGKVLVKSDRYDSRDLNCYNRGEGMFKSDKRIYTTKTKPSALKVELTRYFRHKWNRYPISKNISTTFLFKDLDNIDLATKINNLNHEIMVQERDLMK